MKLLVDRAWKKETYTVSRLFVDGVRFCEVIEDKDRGLPPIGYEVGLDD